MCCRTWKRDSPVETVVTSHLITSSCGERSGEVGTTTVPKRGVAQFGGALGLGPRGRKFKSCHLDYVCLWCAYRSAGQLINPCYPSHRVFFMGVTLGGEGTKPLMFTAFMIKTLIGLLITSYMISSQHCALYIELLFQQVGTICGQCLRDRNTGRWQKPCPNSYPKKPVISPHHYGWKWVTHSGNLWQCLGFHTLRRHLSVASRASI